VGGLVAPPPRQLDRELAAVIVNALLPRRFTPTELDRIESLSADADRGDGTRSAAATRVAGTAQRSVIEAAVRAARTVHDRARFQHNQLARLRRRSFDVIAVPYMWGAELDLAAVGAIAKRLEHKL
jgi:hypothetical protein